MDKTQDQELQKKETSGQVQGVQEDEKEKLKNPNKSDLPYNKVIKKLIRFHWGECPRCGHRSKECVTLKTLEKLMDLRPTFYNESGDFFYWVCSDLKTRWEGFGWDWAKKRNWSRNIKLINIYIIILNISKQLWNLN